MARCYRRSTCAGWRQNCAPLVAFDLIATALYRGTTSNMPHNSQPRPTDILLALHPLWQSQSSLSGQCTAAPPSSRDAVVSAGLVFTRRAPLLHLDAHCTWHMPRLTVDS